ncbi:MAG: sugar phosphate isomerase/epimerase [Clostridia bacterium]|nr:sugar phosphate isomerase/epimerase [Clostridia bacterium]
MQLGLSTAAFYGRLETEEAAERIAELGFDCAEVFLQSESENTKAFAALVRRNLQGVPCTSVHPLGGYENYMAGRPARQVRDAFDHFQRILDAGVEMGAKTFVYHGRNTPLLKPLPWDLAWNVGAVAPMCEEAARRGMVIGWENVSWCQLTEPKRVLEAREALPNVRFTLDIKQAMRAGCDPIEFVYAMGDRLCNVHICDWQSDGRLCLPGEGVFAFETLIGALKEVGYAGPVIMEPYLRLIQSDEALARSVAYMRDIMEGENGYEQD